MELSRRCPAKINLFLKVMGRRADGFHELETLFQEISLADQLSFTSTDEPLSLRVEGAELGPLEENLVWRAAMLYSEVTGFLPRGRLFLQKRIPAGAGLGGGSSDAASTLLLLNELAGARLSLDALADLALSLGSDVPFFLVGGCQLGRGRGELLSAAVPPASPRQGWLLLPGIHLSTPAVFKAYASGVREVTPSQRVVGENHLLAAACSVSPRLKQLYESLRDLLDEPACPFFMTGSGSTCVWLSEATTMPDAIAQRLVSLDVAFQPFSFT